MVIVIVHVLLVHMLRNIQKNVKNVNPHVYNVQTMRYIVRNVNITCLHIVANAHIIVQLVHMYLVRYVHHVNFLVSNVLTNLHVNNVSVGIYSICVLLVLSMYPNVQTIYIK